MKITLGVNEKLLKKKQKKFGTIGATGFEPIFKCCDHYVLKLYTKKSSEN